MKAEALMRNGSSGLGIVLAFVAGAAIGAVAALLLAPARGEDSRRKLADAARNARKAVQHMPALAFKAGAAETAMGDPH